MLKPVYFILTIASKFAVQWPLEKILEVANGPEGGREDGPEGRQDGRQRGVRGKRHSSYQIVQQLILAWLL